MRRRGGRGGAGGVQDTQDPNPLIRALAVRTMGCIRVDKITEYLCDPLQRCLKVRPPAGHHHSVPASHSPQVIINEL